MDAPSIAVAWAALLARIAGTRLTVAEGCLLAGGTWLVYVLDRLLDSVPGRSSPQLLRERHHFHRLHSRRLLLACSVVLALVLALASRLPSPLLALYLLLALCMLVYALLVHAPGRGWRLQGTGKEGAVGLLFTAAACAPAWVRSPAGQRGQLLTLACLLAGLCWLNCAIISLWEEERSVASWSAVRRRLRLCCLGLAAGALLSAAALRGLSGPAGRLTGGLAGGLAAISFSALALWAIARARRQSARRVRVLADLALLTPLVMLGLRAL